MGLKILRDIASKIINVEFFAVMVDETANVSNTEQLVLCIRLVDDNSNAHKEFIGLHSLEVTNADTIVAVIKDIWLSMNISLNKCRSQWYDGCSTMKGQKSGVAKQIKDIEEKALFTQCYTHSLNVAVGDAIKNSNVMKDALETTFEITKLIKKSPKRDAILDAIKKEAATINSNENRIETITLLCPTRWTVRAKSLGTILRNYTYLKELWEWVVNNCSDTEMKARIRGVDACIRSFDYVFSVYLGELILSHSDNLSKTLQSSTLSAVQGQDCANLTIKNVSSKAKSLDVDEPKLPRKRGTPKRLEDFHGYGPAKPIQLDKPKDLYRKHYYEALDHVVNCIKERFNQEDYRKYAAFQELILKAARKQPFSTELEEVLQFYNSDFDGSLLKSKLTMFEEDFPKINSDVNFTDVVKYLKGLHVGKKHFSLKYFDSQN
ncbi:zinc finger MYM-type protein 1-like [Hydractinia symbiolongicarpus]|uniref:zinc finger MYM-type protein 1-like n=1 Tax=Hydractinia symbiolongicarpus TaxID=13093 RepID=UPI00254A621D|nr:zinc finger MYM-type protein 1-like [Hydractinia symbiolongicarpus]